jgi:hypothetical protein
MPVTTGNRGRLGEENSISVDEFDLRALADEGDGLALEDGDADLIREETLDCGVLDPGNLFELLAALFDGDEKDVAADVFAEDGKHVGAADLGETSRLNVCGSGDAEAGVVLEEVGESVSADGNDREDGDGGGGEENATESCRGTPPGALDLFAEATGTRADGARLIIIIEIHIRGHSGQSAVGDGDTCLGSPEARFRGHFILPHHGPGFIFALCHAVSRRSGESPRSTIDRERLAFFRTERKGNPSRYGLVKRLRISG